MKNTTMTSLIRQKHEFKYHGKTFFCYDLSVEDFLLLSIDPVAWLEKIFLECNDESPKLNERQTEAFLTILQWWEIKKKNIIDSLTETQKKINQFKKTNEKKRDYAKEQNDMLSDFHIIEWQLMHFLNQPLSELRKWPYNYFIQMFKDLAYCTWAKEYQKNRNSQSPDKKWFKKEFPNAYNK